MEARIRRTGWRPCDGPLASQSPELRLGIHRACRLAPAKGRGTQARLCRCPARTCLSPAPPHLGLARRFPPPHPAPPCPGTALSWPVLQSRGGRSGPFRGCPLHIGLLDFSLFFLSNEKKFQA